MRNREMVFKGIGLWRVWAEPSLACYLSAIGTNVRFSGPV